MNRRSAAMTHLPHVSHGTLTAGHDCHHDDADRYRGTALPFAVHMTEPAGVDTLTPSARRRAVLSGILRERADPILERTVAETMRATDFAGLGHMVAARYLGTARASLPLALDALAADDPERSGLLDRYAATVKEIVAEGVPVFVQRSLVSLGFKVANGIARDGARARGFEPDELEDELRVFQRAFEARLFFGV